MVKQAWSGRFTTSFNHWFKKHSENPLAYEGSVEEFVRAGTPRDEPDEVSGLYGAAFSIIARQAARRAYHDLIGPWKCCESPIEFPMLFALAIVGDECGSVGYFVRGVRYGGEETGQDLLIEPQAQLGKHRVDFLLTYKEVGPDFSVIETSRDGREIPGVKEEKRMMVVECDGHDFHDRSKEQARADRQRDRWLQSLGYQVFRFTGSEIWQDVFACAQEAIGALVRFEYEAES